MRHEDDPLSRRRQGTGGKDVGVGKVNWVVCGDIEVSLLDLDSDAPFIQSRNNGRAGNIVTITTTTTEERDTTEPPQMTNLLNENQNQTYSLC